MTFHNNKKRGEILEKSTQDVHLHDKHDDGNTGHRRSASIQTVAERQQRND